MQGLSNSRALGELNVPVYVIDRFNCIARYSKYCNKFFRCPNYIGEDFISFLLEINKKYNLSGWALIPSNDHALFNISKNKKILEKYYKIITDDFDVISNIYYKNNLLNIARKLDIPLPLTYLPYNCLQQNIDIKFPVIIKGNEGLTFYKVFKKKVIICNDINSLRNTLNDISQIINLENILIQEVVETDNICSFTCFAVKGEIKTFWLGGKIREHPLKFGTATYAKSISPNETKIYSEKLIKELNYTGVCEIEYLYDKNDKTYKLIELNARTWLWVGLAKYCGINYAKYIYNYLNEIPTNYPKEYKINIKWMNFWLDLIYIIVGLVKGKYQLDKIIKSFKGKVIIDLFKWNDPLPFIMMFFLLPYLKIKRN